MYPNMSDVLFEVFSSLAYIHLDDMNPETMWATVRHANAWERVVSRMQRNLGKMVSYRALNNDPM